MVFEFTILAGWIALSYQAEIYSRGIMGSVREVLKRPRPSPLPWVARMAIRATTDWFFGLLLCMPAMRSRMHREYIYVVINDPEMNVTAVEEAQLLRLLDDEQERLD